MKRAAPARKAATGAWASLRGPGALAVLLRGMLKANLIHHLAHTGGRDTVLRIGRAAESFPDWLPDGAEPGPEQLESIAALRDPDAAERRLSALLRRRPGWAPALAARGLLRVCSRRTAELRRSDPGLRDLEEAARLDPRSLWARAGIGLTWLRIWEPGSFERAASALDEAVRIAPDWSWGRLLRAEARRSLLDYEGALEDFDEALRLDPGFAWAYAFRARVYFQLRTRAQDNKDMDRAIRLDPAAGWMPAWRGEARRRLGDQAGAERDFKKAIALDPLYDQVYFWRSKLLAERGDYGPALASLEEGIRLCPEFEKAYRQKVRVLRLAGRTAEALKTLRRAAALNHRNNWLGVWRVEGALSDPALERSMDELDRHIAKRPKDAWALAWRGESRVQLGRLDEGLADLDRALKLDPSLAWAYAWRGECRIRRDEPAAARRDLDRAVRLDPSYGRAWVWRGCLRRFQKDYEGAVADLDRALAERRVELSWIFGWRGDAKLRLGRVAEARADIEAAINLDQNCKGFHRLREEAAAAALKA